MAVSRACRELGDLPEKISVQVSFNIYKNGVSVGIPGTDVHGLELAAALGAFIENYENGLAVLSHVTDALLKQAKGFVTDGRVILTYWAAPDLHYVRACHIPDLVGIIGNTVEQTFANIGRLNDPGMVETEKKTVSVICTIEGRLKGRR